MKEKKVKHITKYILIGISILVVFSLFESFRELFYLHQFENRIEDENIDPTTGEEYSTERKLDHFYKPRIRRLIQNNPNKALKYIDSIIELYPESNFLHFDKAMAFYEIDSFQKAIKEFDKVIKYENEPHITSLIYKNDCLIQLNRYDESIDILFKLVEFNENYYVEIAQVYEWKKDYSNSIKNYKKVLSIWENSEDKDRLSIEIKNVKEKIEKLEKK